MPDAVNIYCDESCHLEHDGQSAMVLGAIWCPCEDARAIAIRLRELKTRHGLPPGFETKWTKVSPGKLMFYLDTLDYFFDNDDLHFRALVVPDKAALRHAAFRQTHDEFYYKMYFDMLKVILSPRARYRIYVDMKDTRGGEKAARLRDVLCNNVLDFSRDIVETVQLVRSHEVEQVQLADLLVGAVSYLNRGLDTSTAKLALVHRLRERSGYSLDRTTLLREDKVNLLIWRAS
jgi:hypothetical protein